MVFFFKSKIEKHIKKGTHIFSWIVESAYAFRSEKSDSKCQVTVLLGALRHQEMPGRTKPIRTNSHRRKTSAFEKTPPNSCRRKGFQGRIFEISHSEEVESCWQLHVLFMCSQTQKVSSLTFNNRQDT